MAAGFASFKPVLEQFVAESFERAKENVFNQLMLPTLVTIHSSS